MTLGALDRFQTRNPKRADRPPAAVVLGLCRNPPARADADIPLDVSFAQDHGR
jgi:hypothetical protein